MITVQELTGNRYFDGTPEIAREKTFDNEKDAMGYIDALCFDAKLRIKDDRIGALADGGEWLSYQIWKETLRYNNIK